MITTTLILDGKDFRRQENILRLFCEHIVQCAVLDTGDPCAEWHLTLHDHQALARLIDRLQLEDLIVCAVN